jgi:hypothetical protein
MAHQITDDEYERLIALDNAEETGDPWRTECYGKEGEPVGEIRIEIEKPVHHRLIPESGYPAERVPRVCLTCYHRQDHCICLD